MRPTLLTALSGPRTHKGAITLETSSSSLADLFFLLGAMRNADDTQIVNIFNVFAYILLCQTVPEHAKGKN